MSFMKPQVYKGTYFEVDTTEGLQVVPTDVIGRTMNVHVEALLNYLEGRPLDDEQMCEVQEGWLARMSAPGYLDCTPWSAHASESDAHQFLEQQYGSDEAPEEAQGDRAVDETRPS